MFCFDDTEEGANLTCKLWALSNMDLFPVTKNCHSRWRADITSSANNSLIFCRLTVTLDLLAEELCVLCNVQWDIPNVWSGNLVIFSKWFWKGITYTLAAQWGVLHLLPFADYELCVSMANTQGGWHLGKAVVGTVNGALNGNCQFIGSNTVDHKIPIKSLQNVSVSHDQQMFNRIQARLCFSSCTLFSTALQQLATLLACRRHIVVIHL